MKEINECGVVECLAEDEREEEEMNFEVMYTWKYEMLHGEMR